jgi:CubicO group peptidase (beta-lactamase class C family)
MSGWADPVTWEDICDVPHATAKLAEQAPFWEPGTASGYHAHTMGQLIGEVIRRVTGKSLRQFGAEELATPLSSDFFIGAPEKIWPRLSILTETPAISIPPDASLVSKRRLGIPQSIRCGF